MMSSEHPATTHTRQSGIPARYRNSKGFTNDSSFRFAGSPPQKLTSNKSLNESTFTASTVMLDSSMGSSSNEDSSMGPSQIGSPISSKHSTAASSTAGSQTSVSRRSLINRFRKRRQQSTFHKLGVGGDAQEPNSLLHKFSALESQHQQLGTQSQHQETPTASHPVNDGQSSAAPHPQSNQQNTFNGSSTGSFIKKSNARKILSSRIALRARSKGLFPKTTPQTPRHPQPQSMPAHPQQQREEAETAPTEIMAPTEVMQNLSSARGMEPRSATLSEAGAPTEIMTNQTRKQTTRFQLDPPLNSTTTPVVTPSPQHALLDDATVTSEQHSVPIQSLFDLQQSSSISTTNSLDTKKVALHAEATLQSPPRAWENGPKRSLDSLFAKHQQRGGLNKKYSDDASSCFTEERELSQDAVVQRVFSLDKVDLEQAVPLPLPTLLSTNVNAKQACEQVRPRHPTEVSMAIQQPQQVSLASGLNGIPEGTPSQEIDVPMEEGLSFASQEVHAPSLEEDVISKEAQDPSAVATRFASRLVHPPSVSKSGSLEGLAFAKSNDDMLVFEDAQDSFYSKQVASPTGSVQGVEDPFDAYDDLDQLQHSPIPSPCFSSTEVNPPSSSPTRSAQGTDGFDPYDDLDRLQLSPIGCKSFLSTEANPPSIGSLDDEVPRLQQQQEAPVSKPVTPEKQVASTISPDEERKGEGEWKNMIKRYRQRSSDSDKSATQTSPEPTRSHDEPVPTVNVASSPWKEADKVSQFAERRSFGSIKERIKAFDKPQKVWKPPVKGKTWKPPSKVASPQKPSPVSNPTLQTVDRENNYHFEEKKTEEEPYSIVRDDDADNVSVKSMKDVWESIVSGSFLLDEKEDFDIDNDTIRDGDDDDCASVKSLRDAWEIKFSTDDLENGFDDDLEEDAGTVKSRRDELQQRISDQQGIPRVVSVDEGENDDVDDGNASVKSLRKRFDTSNAPKRESVNRLRAMFESSGAAGKSSPARSRSFRANKSPGRAAPARNKSFNSQGSAARCRSNNNSHEDEEDPLRRMAMAWSQKRTEVKSKNSLATLAQPRGQKASTTTFHAARIEIDQAADDQLVSGRQGTQPEVNESRGATNQLRGHKITTSKLEVARTEINQAPDDQFVAGLLGTQHETKESRSAMNVYVDEKAVSPDSIMNYREKSAEMASNNGSQLIRRQASGEARSAPSMQDRLDRWSSRLKAAKRKSDYVQDSFSMDFSVSESSMNVASSVDKLGQESIDRSPGQEEPLRDPISMPIKADARGNSMDTECSDAVTLDVSIANVSVITDPSSLRTRSQDTLSDVMSSPGRAQVVTSPSHLTVELNQVNQDLAPERSPNLVPKSTETISSLRLQGDTRFSARNESLDPFSSRFEKTTDHVKFREDPFTDHFIAEEKKVDGQDPSAAYPFNPPNLHERRSIEADVFGSATRSASSSLTRFSNSFKKPQTRLRMVPVLRDKSASSISFASEQPVPNDGVHDNPVPKKQAKKVSFKLSDARSMSSEDDSRATEKTASSSELSSLPPIPSQFDDNYEAIMQERHQMLMVRQRAYKERVVTRQIEEPSSWDATPQGKSTYRSQLSEPVVNHRSQGSRQSRTQMRLFGRTHPTYSSAQRSNSTAANKSKAASRSLFSKKAQERRLVETTTPNSSTVTTTPPSQPSSAATRSLFSKKAQHKATTTPLTPPRSEAMEENRGYGYSPMRTESPLKAAIPLYHPRSPMRKQQQPSRKQSTSLYNTVVSTLGFGQTESAHDIVARLQSYQSAHQPQSTPPKRPEPEPAPDIDDFADFANFDSGLAADEWL